MSVGGEVKIQAQSRSAVKSEHSAYRLPPPWPDHEVLRNLLGLVCILSAGSSLP